MIHVSCDLCGKDLTSATDGRFVVRIEVYSSVPPGLPEDDEFDDDALDALAAQLDADPDFEPLPPRDKIRYDLCKSCRRKYLEDPLGRYAQKFDFSPN